MELKPRFEYSKLLKLIPMPYIAQVYNVMIASPGDIEQEKEIARRVILEWNDTNSRLRNIVLLPIDWKHNSSPAMGGRPQSHINEQVLSNADILVGIFWKRVGTPTGTHSSGTVEEIELHMKKALPTMLYFSNQKVDLESVDLEQYTALKDLTKQYEGIGLVHKFKTPEGFENDFRKHLALTLNKIRFDESYLESSSQRLKMEAPIVSKDAQELLVASANTDEGEILCFETSDGLDIISGGRKFIDVQTPRIKAKWKAALRELETAELIESKNGSIYKVTDLGFQATDNLAESQISSS